MDAVIFDCDGVLVDSEIIVIQAKIDALRNIAIPYSFQEFTFFYLGLCEDDFYKELAVRHHNIFSEVDLDEFRLFLNDRLISLLDDQLNEIPGIRSFIENIKSKKCVASNGGALGVEKKLKKVGLYEQFYPFIYSGDMVLKKKPEPDIYLLASQNLLVSPDLCIVVEDTPNGIKAAHKAGMLPVGLMIGSHSKYMNRDLLTDAGAKYVFDTIQELQQFLFTTLNKT